MIVRDEARSIDGVVAQHQERLLELMASGAGPATLLEQLIASLESLIPTASCSILLASEDGSRLRHGAAPNLPESYCRAIDGIAVADGSGSCGTAAHRRELVVVRDTLTDRRWQSFRELAIEHRLGACWSSPIIAPAGDVLGTFAVYHEHAHAPAQQDIDLLQRFSGLAAVAIRHEMMLEERRLAQEAKTAAEQQALALEQLLRSISHELRTPLSSIAGFSELLRTTDLPEARRELAVEHLTGATSHLLELVEDLLNVARLQAGAAEVRLAPTLISPLIDEAIVILEPLAAEHRVSVCVAPGTGDAIGQADRRWLRQALLNLIGNAIKFNRADGTVEITTRADGSTVLIVVADTGLGVPADADERLFAPFDRLGQERSAVPGTGLGLAISRQYVEAMGGRLALSPRPGGGTTATIELAAAPPGS